LPGHDVTASLTADLQVPDGLFQSPLQKSRFINRQSNGSWIKKPQAFFRGWDDPSLLSKKQEVHPSAQRIEEIRD
jgi:hypothetical protein